MHPSATSKFLLTLLSSSATTLALPQTAAPPSPSPAKPALTDISYWGSACPANDINGLTTSIGPLNTTTNTYPLTFTLSNFLPKLDGSFGSSLRMCDIVGTLVVPRHDGEETKWKSIGLLDVQGPLKGLFTKQLIPEEADEGVVGTCGAPAELDVEFQARAVMDFERSRANAANGTTAWVLRTDLEVVQC
ncbi:hypothetical protein DM02DRAFT_723790 [Periconia macrospinosa]|uniref:Ubiquitin 3 binding protein But2 C-terminal domain-containing protein n=1 Tax=Periconia macrospinosa TaxID=97972 RepID=A0A2V1E9E3_9PLEO|nr:hypothetical protein DM02DRAFT_723790 [Periconia macrospinosa]